MYIRNSCRMLYRTSANPASAESNQVECYFRTN